MGRPVIEAVRLYWSLREERVVLTVAQGQLVFDAPKGTVTHDTRARLREHMPALVRLLSEPCPCAPCVALSAAPPALRLHCASGLDMDPMWVAVRREFDTLDEAAERTAIQAEGAA